MSQKRIKRFATVLLVLIATSCMAASAAAQEAPPSPSAQNSQEEQKTAGQPTGHTPEPSPREFLHTFSQDEWRMWTSPFHLSTYGSHTVKKYGIPFLLISAASLATD